MSTALPSERYINRELSWLEFNRRVLQEAQNPENPPLERAKFLAIFCTNLDEFYMVRVSGLHEQVAAGVAEPSPDGRLPEMTLEEVNAQVSRLQYDHCETWKNQVQPLLHAHGVQLLSWDEVPADAQADLTQLFERTIYPILTPLAVDPAHPFPHISNLSLNLAVEIVEAHERHRFARVKVPTSIPRFIEVKCEAKPNERKFVWVEDVIAANISSLFVGMTIRGVYPFRVTRDTDVEIEEDEAGDLRATIEETIWERRFGGVVRLEITEAMPDAVCAILLKNLKLKPRDVQRISSRLGLDSLWELYRLPLPALKDEPFAPSVPAFAQEGLNIFDRIRQGDLLLHHPYESFATVVDFIRAAASDPQVLAIKQTLYRVGTNSPVVHALMEAVENEKQVAVLVELKARFDEENNIRWTRELEKLGVHMVYGLPGYKVHAKVCQVVRREADGIRIYLHLGTGNYNAGTARLYTDLSLLTSDPELGQDASELFNYLTGYSRQRHYRKLLVAPVGLRKGLVKLIEHEIETHLAHGNGRLIFKMNSLVDVEMIEMLYRASQAGVKIDLIVRGICCLRPGVPGLSDNIRVVSVVGRFLEHSRVYYFGNGGDEKIYAGSADLMERNLDRRVEVVFPIQDDAIKQRIKDEILHLGVMDNEKARVLCPDGTYAQLSVQPGDPAINSQRMLMKS